MCIFQSDLILYVLPLHSIFKNSINRIIIFKDNYLQVKYIKKQKVIFIQFLLAIKV